MTIRILLPLLLLAATATRAGAQDAVEVAPGNALVATGHFRERTETFHMLREGERIATVRLSTRFAVATGRPVVVRVEALAAGDRTMGSDSFVVDRGTLAPLSVSRTGEGMQQASFDGLRVRREGRAGAKRTAATTVLEGPAFYGNSLDLVLGALPLREGFRARLALYEPEDAGRAWTTIRVAGSESVRTDDGGSCRAWRVEVEGGDHEGTYWIEQASRTLAAYQPEEEGFVIRRRDGCGELPST